jgi:hypothetical protein
VQGEQAYDDLAAQVAALAGRLEAFIAELGDLTAASERIWDRLFDRCSEIESAGGLWEQGIYDAGGPRLAELWMRLHGLVRPWCIERLLSGDDDPPPQPPLRIVD